MKGRTTTSPPSSTLETVPRSVPVALMSSNAAELSTTLKTAGPLQARIITWITPLWIGTVALYLVASLATMFVSPFLFEGMLANPLFYVLFLLLLAACIMIPVAVKAGKFGRAFAASSIMIAMMIGLSALSLFPRLVPALDHPELSLTIYNASSSEATLTTMLVIALIGMPLVIAYTIFIYRAFKGKVVITGDSY